MKTVAEMKARLRAIAVEAETAEGEALNALLEEADGIKAKIEEAEARAHIKGIADGISGDPADGKPGEKGDDVKAAAGKRSDALKSGKAVKYEGALTPCHTVMCMHNTD